MQTVTASPTRTGEYTQVKRCHKCARAFWAKASWNAVMVRCPHCEHVH